MFEIEDWDLILGFMFGIQVLICFWVHVWDSGLGFWFGFQLLDSVLLFRLGIQI